ncbi:MAG: WbuC family cupin fold metalloprotein [bacterium]|nr:WbuC family cupin fold metalloprotein [bacterium]
MLKITNRLISEVSKKAEKSERKRSNYNFHRDYNDGIQRFLNAAEKGSYLRPHQHSIPDKWEAFILIKGRALVLEFDSRGNIRDHVILDARHCPGVEIPPKAWHSFIPLKNGTVLYEIARGPYTVGEKIFAPWAPEEGSPEARGFNRKILKKLKVK